MAIFWLKNAPAALKMLARCPTLLRFSVGIEDIEDIWADIAAALAGV